MVNHIKVVIVAFIFGFLGFMGYSIALKYLEKESIRERISTIPSFRLERLAGDVFTENELAEGPVVLDYFNSTCDFCRAKSKAIKLRIEEFRGIQLVFVSSEEKVIIEKFSEENGLNKYPNVVFLHDSNMAFSKAFGVTTIPATFIYSRDRKLIKEFKGAVKIESILEVL